MGRAPCCDKANVKKGPWSPEEDATLKAYIDKYGTGGNWIALPQKVGLKRCGKSCRLRWLNYLRPNLKHGGFTEEEDNIICSLYISIGSRWSIIAAQLPGRTDNDIKNYWNTRLKKKLLGRRKQSNGNRLSLSSGQDPKDVLSGEDNSNNLHNLSSSAVERLQLHMQLQSLQNPYSLYNTNDNSPSLLPKLSPLQQKMLQTLNSMNENQKLLMQQTSSSYVLDPNVLEQDYHALSSMKKDELNTEADSFVANNERVVVGSGENMGLQPGYGFTQAELDELLNNKLSSSFVPTTLTESHHQFDSFKSDQMDEGSKVVLDNNLGWWSNEFDTNSASSNSWDSTNNVLHHQSGEMFQDYTMGAYSCMQ